MSKIYQSITELIGRTPLVELKRLKAQDGLKAKVLVKLEYFNPARKREGSYRKGYD